MGFFNSSNGFINHALGYDEGGNSLETYFQLAKVLCRHSRFYLVIIPDGNNALEGLYPLYNDSDPKRRKQPFVGEIDRESFRRLLNDNLEREKIWSILIDIIRPIEVSNTNFKIYYDVDRITVDSEKTGKALLSNVSIAQTLSSIAIADDIIVPSVDSKKGIAIKGRYAEFVKNVLIENNFKIDHKGPNTVVENGDVMAAEGFVFIGYGTFKQFCGNRPESPEIVKKFKNAIIDSYYNNETKPEIHIVGKDRFLEKGGGFYHLDLFFNYAGKVDNDKHLFFLSYIPDSVINRLYSNDEAALEKVRKEKDHLDEIYCELNSIDKSKFIIARIPMVKDGDNIYTYNNGLMEQNRASAYYYMPHYKGITEDFCRVPENIALVRDAVEKSYLEAYGIIHSFGIDIFPVDVSRSLNHGVNQALHCSVAVLNRDSSLPKK